MPRLAELRAGTQRAELRRVLEHVSVAEVIAAWRFARRYGVSLLVYPNARKANLHMLPPWVDPRDGLVVDIGANEGGWTAEILRVFPQLEVVAPEPGPEPRARLQARFAGRKNVAV